MIAIAATFVLGVSALRAQSDPTTRPARIAVGERLPDLLLRDLDGRVRDRADWAGSKALVLVYFATGCPINKLYAPRYKKTIERYRPHGVKFLGVSASPQDSIDDVRAFLADQNLDWPVVRDKDAALTRALGAVRTTEIFVFDGEMKLAYSGRLDDQYSLTEAAAGAYKDVPEANHLTDALDAVLAGKKPAITHTDAPGCLIGRPQAPTESATSQPTVTYYKDVEPIIQRRCQVCHRDGEIAPFALQEYDDVFGWADMIAETIANGRMPPWNADPHFGQFKNDRTMPEAEKAVIAQWIASGRAAGDPATRTKAPEFPKGWRIGTPDAVFEMQETFTIPAEGTIDLKYFVVPVPYAEDRWVKAIEIRPGAREAVHHVAVFNVRFDDAASVAENMGFSSGLNGFWALMAPGEEPTVYPDGMAKRLTAKSALVISMHYSAIGKELKDKTRIGVIFAKEPPIHEVKTATVTTVEQLLIEPNNPEKIIEAGRFIDETIKIISIVPHMHMRGKAFRFKVDFVGSAKVDEVPKFERLVPYTRLRSLFDPVTRSFGYFGQMGEPEIAAVKAAFDGETSKKAVDEIARKAKSDVLLWVPHFDFRWQHTYRPIEPILVPKGSLLHCIGIYDNSKSNRLLTEKLRSTEVRWGSQIWDEMMMGCYDYISVPE